MREDQNGYINPTLIVQTGESSRSPLVKIEALNEHRANKQIIFQSIINETPILTMFLDTPCCDCVRSDRQNLLQETANYVTTKDMYSESRTKNTQAF